MSLRKWERRPTERQILEAQGKKGTWYIIECMDCHTEVKYGLPRCSPHPRQLGEINEATRRFTYTEGYGEEMETVTEQLCEYHYRRTMRKMCKYRSAEHGMLPPSVRTLVRATRQIMERDTSVLKNLLLAHKSDTPTFRGLLHLIIDTNGRKEN